MSTGVTTVEVGGAPLSLESYQAVATGGVEARLAEPARERMRSFRESLLRQLSQGVRIYGVNTGFGADSGRLLAPDLIRTVQRNTVLSHAVGVGPSTPVEIVRGMMLIKANVMAMGYSAVRPELADLLLAMLNQDVIPVVPEQGSLAASGDLVPSGHLAIALIGEGDVLHQGARVPARDALARAGLQALTLEEKEGLALVNGTAFSEAYALAAVGRARRLLATADLAGAASLQALRGHLEAFSERAVSIRPHPGSLRCAANLRELSAGAELLAGTSGRVHDPYCLRCMPQVHGASRDAFEYVTQAVTIELNSFTDNPLVFADDDTWVSAGHFHAQPIALPMDLLAVLVAELGSLSQRRTQHLVSPVYDPGPPPKLSRYPDEGSGLFMLNTTAAALVSENRTLCFPASVDSMAVDTTEDHVSMASVAARKAMAVITNTSRVLALELACACQAIELQAPLKSSEHIAELLRAVRRHVPFVEHDRTLSAEIGALADAILSGEVSEAVERSLGHPLV